jgi:uncharacterized Fe-S cluster-containing protein
MSIPLYRYNPSGCKIKKFASITWAQKALKCSQAEHTFNQIRTEALLITNENKGRKTDP